MKQHEDGVSKKGVQISNHLILRNLKESAGLFTSIARVGQEVKKLDLDQLDFRNVNKF